MIVKCRARMLVPRKNTPRIAAIQASVIEAFRALGFRNAPTPFEIASVPVMATQPSAKPRRIRNANAKPTGADVGVADAGAARVVDGPPVHMWNTPTPIIAHIITMNTYVGTLKAMPDSRTPRRLTIASSATAATHKRTVCDSSCGYADVIAATPPEIDTDTVRM